MSSRLDLRMTVRDRPRKKVDYQSISPCHLKRPTHTIGERNILVRTTQSDSPFILGLKFSFQTPSDLYLVADYVPGGELFWHI
jgi:hypothetical protein